MKTSLNNKNKSIILVIGFFIFLIITYNIALKQTVNVWDQYISLQKDLMQANYAPSERIILKKEIIQIDSVIGNTQRLATSQELILNELVNYCKTNQLKVREFPKTHSINDGDFEIETNTVTVEGNFIELLKLLYAFEHKRFAGKLASAKFQLNEDISSHRKYLTLTFYIQNFKSSLKLSEVNDIK